MVFDEKQEVGKGFVGLKHQLRKIILEGYQITIDDKQTVDHYFRTQDQLDWQICKLMGWKYE